MEKRYINRHDLEEIRDIKSDHLGRMKKLVSGEIGPASENERRFVRYANGDDARPSNIYERAWEHYMRLLDPGWRIHSLSSSSNMCDRCFGDGGINGGCAKCDGKGWLPCR